MIKTRGVNHIALRISDVARASDFYGKLLGLEVVPYPKMESMDREKMAEFRNEVVSSKGAPGPTGGIWFAAGNNAASSDCVSRTYGTHRKPVRTTLRARGRRFRRNQAHAAASRY